MAVLVELLKQRAPWTAMRLFLDHSIRWRKKSCLFLWLFLFHVVYVFDCVCILYATILSLFFKPIQVCRIDAVDVIINIFMKKKVETTNRNEALNSNNERRRNFETSPFCSLFRFLFLSLSLFRSFPQCFKGWLLFVSSTVTQQTVGILFLWFSSSLCVKFMLICKFMLHSWNRILKIWLINYTTNRK